MDDVKVLVVEDDKISALYVKGLLIKIGYEDLAFARNSEEALEKAKAFQPDICLMDIMLGKDSRDGIETAHMIKERIDVPIVYLTGQSDQATLNKAKFTDPYGYLLKPVNEKDLRVSIDMTLHKFKMDKENKRLTEKLRETQFQLINQEKMASVGQLAAGMAHEINNPLGFIQSNTETLREYFDTYRRAAALFCKLKNEQRCKEHLAAMEGFPSIEELEALSEDIQFINDDVDDLFVEMNEGLQRIDSIIKNLRMFSRVDTLDGFENYDLNANVQSTVMVMKSETDDELDVTLTLDQLPVTRGCAYDLNQVILELLQNAAFSIRSKRSGEKGVIGVATYERDGYVCCRITDNGCGIEREQLTKIFNPFFTTKDVNEGKGLGLSMAHYIVTNKHKGLITVESTAGVGAEFVLKLPVMQED